MNDVTLLIQGKLDYECFNFYVRNYPNVPIVYSTWENEIENIEKLKKIYKNLPPSYAPNPELSNIKIVFSQIPKKTGIQNFNLQCVSTLNGLKLVDTELVIKLRSDEYYSNLLTLLPSAIETKKIYCSPLFFRSMKEDPEFKLEHIFNYHISDHLFVGYKKDIYEMFSTAYQEVEQIKNDYTPEHILTKSYLKYKGFTTLDNFDEGRRYMIESFDIIDLKFLKPYKMVVNFMNLTFRNNYDVTFENYGKPHWKDINPEQIRWIYNCIDKMEDL